MNKLRAGVIGLRMGRHHVERYQEHPQCEVVAVCDIDEEVLGDIGDKYGVKRRYTEAAEMLAKEDLDVVSVATPNCFHAPLSIQALQAGAHVLCEKPMALRAAEARQMLAAARKAGRRLMIDFSYRFTPEGWALKKQVDSGLLGEVYFGRTVWHRRRGIPRFAFTSKCRKDVLGGGHMVDLGVHRIDLALWLMGSPKPQWALGGAYDHIGKEIAKARGGAYDVEDLASGFVRFENGATLVVEASWAANTAERELMETRLYGTKAGLVHRNVGEGYNFEAEIYMEREGVPFDMKLHPPVPDCPLSAMHYFADCILNDEPHMATGEEGLLVTEIMDAIYASAEKGGPVRIEGGAPS